MTVTRKEPVIKQYAAIFDRVHNQRLKFYGRLAALLAGFIAFLLTVSFNSQWVFLPIKGLLLWGGFLLFRYTKDQILEVQASRAGNQLERIILNFYSWKFVKLFTTVTINNFIVWFIVYLQSGNQLQYYIETPTKTIKPFLSTNFTFFWFFMIVTSFSYSACYATHEHYQLSYTRLLYRQDPVEYLKSLAAAAVVLKPLIFSLLTSLAIPILFHVCHEVFFYTFMYPMIPLFSLNSQRSRESYSLTLLAVLTLVNSLAFVTFDLLSYIYNAYATIGCLVVDKPISSYSETPFPTLVSGLKDLEHPLARITAFQEILYMATSPNIKVREVLYRADNWNVILDQLSFILSNAARSSRSDLPNQKVTHDNNKKQIANEVSIFGNLSSYKDTFDQEKLGKKSKFNDEGEITIVKDIEPSELFKTKTVEQVINSKKQTEVKKYVATTFQSIEKVLNKLVTNVQLKLKKLIDDESTSEQIKKIYFSSIDTLNFLFYGNVQFQASKRLPNKYLVELSIESLAEIMIHSKGEERNNVIFDTLTESLILIAKVYKGTSLFMSNFPNGRIETSSISEVNQLAMKNFYKMIVFYNSVLNDLILPPEVFKLAKWCTDLAVEMEKEELEWN